MYGKSMGKSAFNRHPVYPIFGYLSCTRGGIRSSLDLLACVSVFSKQRRENLAVADG